MSLPVPLAKAKARAATEQESDLAARLRTATAELARAKEAQAASEAEMLAQRAHLAAAEQERRRLAGLLEAEGSAPSPAAHAAALEKKDELIMRLTSQLDFLNGQFEALKKEQMMGATKKEIAEAAKVARERAERAEAAKEQARKKSGELADQLRDAEESKKVLEERVQA